MVHGLSGDNPDPTPLQRANAPHQQGIKTRRFIRGEIFEIMSD
jgi:hypothetical protein